MRVRATRWLVNALSLLNAGVARMVARRRRVRCNTDRQWAESARSTSLNRCLTDKVGGHGSCAPDEARIVDGEMLAIFVEHSAPDHYRPNGTSVFPVNNLIGCICQGDERTSAEVEKNEVGHCAALGWCRCRIQSQEPSRRRRCRHAGPRSQIAKAGCHVPTSGKPELRAVLPRTGSTYRSYGGVGPIATLTPAESRRRTRATPGSKPQIARRIMADRATVFGKAADIVIVQPYTVCDGKLGRQKAKLGQCDTAVEWWTSGATMDCIRDSATCICMPISKSLARSRQAIRNSSVQ